MKTSVRIVFGMFIFLMVLCVIMSIWKPDHVLVQSGLEVYKRIVITIAVLEHILSADNAKMNNGI